MAEVTLSGGARIWYQTVGTGAPLLQIHGSAFGHKNFARLTPLMAKHFTVVEMDLPGYGDSHGGPPLTDFESAAALVAEFIRATGHERVHVHGTSFGAMIALVLAAQHPDVVDRLVLSCFVARYDEAARMMRSTWKRAAREQTMDAVAALTAVGGFARSYYETDGAKAQLEEMYQAFDRTKPEAFIAGTELIERTDLSRFVPDVRMPTLLLAGAEDNMTPFRPAPTGVGMATMATAMPDARTVLLERCGHYLVLEQPEVATEHIVAFLMG